MSDAMSNYMESGVLNFVLRANSNSFAAPSNVSVALLTNHDSNWGVDAKNGGTMPEVANAGSYARGDLGAPSNADWDELDLTSIESLTFEKPDFNKFPCMRLAFDALEQEGTVPALLNVVNEYSVYRFLNNEISFIEIPQLIERAFDEHDFIKEPSIDDVLNIEIWAQEFVKSYTPKN